MKVKERDISVKKEKGVNTEKIEKKTTHGKMD